jgi:hypothetical protein
MQSHTIEQKGFTLETQTGKPTSKGGLLGSKEYHDENQHQRGGLLGDYKSGSVKVLLFLCQ